MKDGLKVESKDLAGYKSTDFDAHFLSECKDFIGNLIEIRIEEIKLSELKFVLRLNYGSTIELKKIASVNEMPAYKFLEGNKNEFLNYKQFNYADVTNEKRLLSTLDSIKKNGYPFQNQYIVLFNGQNFIRDGQHRAIILAHLKGIDTTIPIMRFVFKGKFHYTYPSDNKIYAGLKWIARRFYKLFN